MNFLNLPLAVLFLLLLFVLQPCLAEEIDESTLIYRGEMGKGGTIYDSRTDKPVTGRVVRKSNGRIEWKASFKKGKVVGTYEEYDENGGLHGLAEFRNVWLHGPVKRFHKNGWLFKKGNHQHGKKRGLWEYFHENGNLQITETSKDGEFVNCVGVLLYHGDRLGCP